VIHTRNVRVTPIIVSGLLDSGGFELSGSEAMSAGS
jgi:hypothetical protein